MHAALLLCCFSCSVPTAPAKRHRLPSLRTCRQNRVSLVGARVKGFWFHTLQVQVTRKLRSSNCRRDPSSATLFISFIPAVLRPISNFTFCSFCSGHISGGGWEAGTELHAQCYSIHEWLFSQISALAVTSNVPVFKVPENTFFSSSFLLHSLVIIAFTLTYTDRECGYRQTKRADCCKVRRD